MNPNQLATLTEAQEIASRLGLIGNGVAEIYIPEYGGPFLPPSSGEAKFYHFKFRNGATGFNVGLIRTTMQYFPTRWPMMILLEVESAAASGDKE